MKNAVHFHAILGVTMLVFAAPPVGSAEVEGLAGHPSLPGFTYTTELEQVFLDTFLFDSDGDGAADTDITFCSQKGDPGFMMWMRNRLAVGERQLTPRTAGRAMSP